MRVTTQSGAVYDIEGKRMRRHNPPDAELRRDGEWLRLLEVPKVVKGRPMVLTIEPLSEGSTYTERRTTPVKDVEWSA